MSEGPLPWGTLRSFRLNKFQAEYHRSHLGRQTRLVYFHADWQRRKDSMIPLRRYWWKPGQSGNPKGRPKGAKDKRPRRKPNGIFEAIRQERQANAERWRQENAQDE
jgi:hypothetical protein